MLLVPRKVAFAGAQGTCEANGDIRLMRYSAKTEYDRRVEGDGIG